MIESFNDKVLQEDLEIIAKEELPFRKFRNSTVFITGVTGLVGLQLFKALACINRVHQLNMKIIGLVRNLDKAEKIFGDLLKRKDIQIVLGDVSEDFHSYIPDGLVIDYIIHGASVTTSKFMIEFPVDTIRVAFDGTYQMLELAKEKKVKSFVYLSSMEVYGSFQSDRTTVVHENMLGYLDLSSVRTNYPECKRICENMCIAFLSQYQVPAKIARLSQTFGAGILPGENRVFAQFARSVMQGKDIVLHTSGQSEGNYCYTADTVVALLTILLRGENGEAYNIANEESHTTIADMAKMVTSQFSQTSQVVFDIPEKNIFGYAVDTKMKLSTHKIQQLGWKPRVSLVDAYDRMMRSMNETGV